MLRLKISVSLRGRRPWQSPTASHHITTTKAAVILSKRSASKDLGTNLLQKWTKCEDSSTRLRLPRNDMIFRFCGSRGCGGGRRLRGVGDAAPYKTMGVVLAGKGANCEKCQIGEGWIVHVHKMFIGVLTVLPNSGTLWINQSTNFCTFDCTFSGPLPLTDFL